MTVQDAGLVPPPPPRAAVKRRRRVPVWGWVLIGLAAIVALVFLSPIIAIAALVVLITGIVAIARNRPTWLRFRSRKVAIWVTAVAAVVFWVCGSITGAVYPSDSGDDGSSGSRAAVRETTQAKPTAEPMPVVTVDPVVDEVADEPFTGEAAAVATTTATTGQTALAVLATLEVKGRAPKTAYDRDQFGQAWLDVDRNGCDTRNDTLARDLTAVAKSGSCKVMSGTLADPYTGKSINFTRGQDTSGLVQIDHVVALSDAWQKGAQQLSADQRATFANDPLNLLAVDGSANMQKRDADAATWLPANKAFRCTYVARQVSVKATYQLSVTQAEHDAIARVLTACPDEPAVTSAYAKIPPPAPEPVQPPAPAPAPPAPAQPAPVPVQPANNCDSNYADACVPIASDVDCAGGSGNGPAYFDGVARIVGSDIYDLDRDHDGYACEPS